MVLRNNTDADRRISGVQSPAFARIELHDHIHDEGGMMRMEAQEFINIPANGEAVLKSGGLHLMLMQPTREINAGDTLAFTFETQDKDGAGMAPIMVDIPVKARR
jgi:copper(I)-binding protein